MGHEIKIDDIISFECAIKLTYKNCEVTVKRYNHILDVHVANFSSKGYYAEKSKDFICTADHDDILNCLNKNIKYIEEVYKKTIEKNARNDSKITDFEEYKNKWKKM